MGIFNVKSLQQIDLHTGNNNAVTNGSFLSTPYSVSTRIGTAYIRGLSYLSGSIGTGYDQYEAYLFNINMASGYAFSQVNSLQLRNLANNATLALADVILTYNAKTNSNVAVLSDANYNKLVYPTGQKALKLDGFNNQSFVYRNQINATFSNTSAGSMTLALSSPIGTGVENFDSGGLLSGQATDTFIVIPTQQGFTSNKAGTVNATSGSANVGGNSSTFLSDYTSGDFIYINSTLSQINAIYSNILLTLTAPFGGTTSLVNTHSKSFPANIPIPFDNNGSHGGTRSISVSGTSAVITLGETLSTSFNATAYFDVLRTYTVPIKKQYNSHVYVAINCASHPNGINGPFSLGLVDVAGINAIYINENSFSNTTTDFSPLFEFNNGQRDGCMIWLQ